MKPIHLVPPTVALLIAVAWLGGQHRTITVLEQESSQLRQQIADARAAETAAGEDDRASATTDKNKPFDWKKIAGDLGDMGRSGQMPDMRAMIRLQQRILDMSEAELTAALDEIAALDLPEMSRQALEGMLIGAIAEKNPELALNRFIGKAHDEGGMFSWQLRQAFAKWLDRNPAAAGAWFDRQIAAGTFDSKSLDGKSTPRSHFEGVIIKSLLSSDPDAAARRLADIQPDLRRDVFRYSVHHVDEKDQKAFADLVRNSLREEERTEIIASQVSRYANGDDLTEINNYLARIDATPEERAASVEKTAESRFNMISATRKVTREDFDQFRTWAGSADPASADRATGTALAASLSTGEGMSFDEASAIASDYHATGAGDDILIPLLESWHARSSKDKAHELAMMIADEKRREEILKNLQ